MDRFRDKQVAEAYFVEFDFTNKAVTAPTIASAVVAAKVVSTGVDATATITTAGSQTISGAIVYVWVKAGTDGTDYQITCTATCTDGSVYELEGLMLVANVPLTAETARTTPGCIIRPTIEPITLAEAKQHLRVDDSDDDELITELIGTAREHVEDITRRALLTQTWIDILQEWPRENYIKLRNGNLQSVSSIKWKDDDGTETTLTVTTDYLVETNGEGIGRVVLPYGGTWPSGTLYPSNPIAITYVCGWTAANLVPGRIRAGVKLILADLYQMRGDPVVGTIITENRAATKLLQSCRIWDEI